MNIWKERTWTPMLLKEKKEPFEDLNYLYELKFDGSRAIVFASPKKITVQNRLGLDISFLYPELQEMRKLVTKNTIIDGEIVSFENGMPSFKKLQERAHLKDKKKILYQSKTNPIIFVGFDLLYQGKDLTSLSLLERKKRLDKIPENDVFVKTKYIQKNGVTFYKQVKELGLEGIVAKKKDSCYEINTRSDKWIKIKNLKQEQFWIGGYIETENSPIISLILGEKKDKTWYYVGRVTMAKKNLLYQKLKKQKIRKTSLFLNSPEKSTFITPKYSCIVEYMERTQKNQLRQPTFRGET